MAAEEAPKRSRGASKLQPLDVVRIGYVGVGGMGVNHVNNLLKIEGVEIRAVSDIVEAKVRRVQEMVVKTGQRKPEGYSRGETDFRRLCGQEDLDLVYTADALGMACACLSGGDEQPQTRRHGGSRRRDAGRMLALVETAEKTGRHCVMMENCCYDRTELMILNMVRKRSAGRVDPRGMRIRCTICGGLMLSNSAAGAGGSPTAKNATAISIPRTDWGPLPSA